MGSSQELWVVVKNYVQYLAIIGSSNELLMEIMGSGGELQTIARVDGQQWELWEVAGRWVLADIVDNSGSYEHFLSSCLTV